MSQVNASYQLLQSRAVRRSPLPCVLVSLPFVFTRQHPPLHSYLFKSMDHSCGRFLSEFAYGAIATGSLPGITLQYLGLASDVTFINPLKLRWRNNSCLNHE